MRNDNLLKEGDWMTRKEAMREKLPADFSNQDIQAKLKEVSLGGWGKYLWGRGLPVRPGQWLMRVAVGVTSGVLVCRLSARWRV